MNAKSNCIVIFDKRLNSYVDKTCEIIKIENNRINAKFIITFSNGKSYEYNKSSVEWLTNPRNIDVLDKIVYSQNKRLTNVKEILDFGSWIKIVFQNNEIRSYPLAKIKIVRNRVDDIEVKNFINYLKDVSMIVDNVYDEQLGFVRSELDKIEVSEDSVLSKFLDNAPIITKIDKALSIFPFSTNTSQIKAVNNALTHNISVIQGPPGTGKTQTILNIIANLLIRGKTVAIVSGNNEATRNVQEKLAHVDLAEIGAFLGNKDNIEKFFEQQCFLNPKFVVKENELKEINNFAELANNAKLMYVDCENKIKQHLSLS